MAIMMERASLDRALAEERARLVALCTRLTGNADAADDLAQETLVEAWRSLTRLRDADGLGPWLSAIARNVCLRWQRAHGRDLAHRATLPSLDHGDEADAMLTLDDLAVGADDGADFTLALERYELATLLDRALGLLPTETRAALVASYVDELPQAEVAARLGVSEGALR
ncbi:MAG: RNA polymerase sigma factor, partial [Ktedonobacterales bacterium]